MHVLIVDDEPLGRSIIREYIERFPELTVVGECENGRTAVEAINRQQPDLVFLDIQMPGLDGFEVLERLTHWPHIIFSTAYDEYAVQAFEINAVDYLLKPFDRTRFATAVERVQARGRVQEPEIERLAGLLREVRSPATVVDRLFVRVGRKIFPVAIDDICWIEAEGDYSILHLPDTSYTCNRGIGELEEQLDASRFVRVHRSSMIAVEKLDHLTSDNSGGFQATLENGTQVRVSRSYAANIRNLVA